MPDERVLRIRARVAIQNGKLPAGPPDQTWGGPAMGDFVCTVCELLILKDEMEIEMQFDRDGSDPGLDKFNVHARCLAAWEFERSSVRPPI